MASRISQRRQAALADGGASYQQRRNEILEVAGQLFKEHGHRGVKIADIASALSADRASIYYYFSSRDEILREIIRWSVGANVAEAERVASGPGSAPEKIHSLVTSLMASYERNFPFPYVFIQEDLSHVGGDPSWVREVEELSHRYDQAVVGIIEAGIEQGTLVATASPRIMAYGLIGMLNWTHRWFHPGGKAGSEEIGEAFSRILLRGMLKD